MSSGENWLCKQPSDMDCDVSADLFATLCPSRHQHADACCGACTFSGVSPDKCSLRPTGPQTWGPAHDRQTGVARLQGGRRASPCTHMAPAKLARALSHGPVPDGLIPFCQTRGRGQKPPPRLEAGPWAGLGPPLAGHWAGDAQSRRDEATTRRERVVQYFRCI